MHSKKNGRPVDTMTTFVEKYRKCFELGGRGDDLQNSEEQARLVHEDTSGEGWWQKQRWQQEERRWPSSRPGHNGFTLWLGSGRRIRSGVETNQPDQQEVRGRETERNKPRRDR